MLDQSRLWIPTPGFNQSHWDESGKCSNPVCQYGLSVRGLWLVLVVSCLVMKKMIPTPSQVLGRNLDPDKLICATSCRANN